MAVEHERETTRDRIITAVLELLDDGGTEAVTTRAVVMRAGTQAPAIYRLFGDMQGLLDAAAERAFERWIERKGTHSPPPDPVDALRDGWDDAVRFGLENPALYRIVNARSSRSASVAEGYELLREKVDRAAKAGRLRVPPGRAAAVLHATGLGATLSQIDLTETERDPAVVESVRDAAIAAITTAEAPEESGVATAAVTLGALLGEVSALSEAERGVLAEWLDRIASTPVASRSD